jgi:hypothetical protein
MKLTNKNLIHLKNIVSEERYWTYEKMVENIHREAKIIKDQFNSRDNKNRNLNWLYDKYFSLRDSLCIEDVREKYFSKRLIQSLIKHAKDRVKKSYLK